MRFPYAMKLFYAALFYEAERNGKLTFKIV